MLRIVVDNSKNPWAKIERLQREYGQRVMTATAAILDATDALDVLMAALSEQEQAELIEKLTTVGRI